MPFVLLTFPKPLSNSKVLDTVNPNRVLRSAYRKLWKKDKESRYVALFGNSELGGASCGGVITLFRRSQL